MRGDQASHVALARKVRGSPRQRRLEVRLKRSDPSVVVMASLEIFSTVKRFAPGGLERGLGEMGHGSRIGVARGDLTAFEQRILTLRITGLSRLQIARE